MQKIIVSPIKGGAIVFTIKVVANMLFVVEDKTPDTLRPCSGYTKVGRYAFEGDEERVGQEHGAPDLLLPASGIN